MKDKAVRYGFVAGRVLLSNIGVLPTPLKLTFALTVLVPVPVSDLQHLEEKTSRRAQHRRDLSDSSIKTARRHGIDLTGGEIFLRKDIGDILERLVRTWHRLVLLHFPTNGFLTESIASTVARVAGLSATPIVVTVSIDGDEALNDEIRGIKGGYKRQIETFRALRGILRRAAGLRDDPRAEISAPSSGPLRHVETSARS